MACLNKLSRIDFFYPVKGVPMTSHQTSSRQTSSVSQAKSASYEVGYGKPPRHTQFQKGVSGNPGGRQPRSREDGPIELLKELTLEEAYREVVLVDEDGAAMPAYAIQAILRSQMELAMNGDIRAQRDIIKAVQAIERENALAAAEKRAREEAELKNKPRFDGNYHDAARRILYLFRLAENEKAEQKEAAEREAVKEEAEKKEAAEREAAAKDGSGAPVKEAATEDGDTKRQAAVPAPSADHASQPENGAAAAQAQKGQAQEGQPQEGRERARAAKPRTTSPAKPRPSRRAGYGLSGAGDGPRRPPLAPMCRQGCATRGIGAGQAIQGRCEARPCPATAGGKNQKIPC